MVNGMTTEGSGAPVFTHKRYSSLGNKRSSLPSGNKASHNFGTHRLFVLMLIIITARNTEMAWGAVDLKRYENRKVVTRAGQVGTTEVRATCPRGYDYLGAGFTFTGMCEDDIIYALVNGRTFSRPPGIAGLIVGVGPLSADCEEDPTVSVEITCGSGIRTHRQPGQLRHRSRGNAYSIGLGNNGTSYAECPGTSPLVGYEFESHGVSPQDKLWLVKPDASSVLGGDYGHGVVVDFKTAPTSPVRPPNLTLRAYAACVTTGNVKSINAERSQEFTRYLSTREDVVTVQCPQGYYATQAGYVWDMCPGDFVNRLTCRSRVCTVGVHLSSLSPDCRREDVTIKGIAICIQEK
jgi:hypothetical protein